MPLPRRYVEDRGIMEGRWIFDSNVNQPMEDDEEHLTDMYDLQETEDELGKDFFKKDKIHGAQYKIYCLVCSCDISSVQTLDSHVQGSKHVKKVLQKRQKDHHKLQAALQENQPPPPQPLPKKKKAKPRVSNKSMSRKTLRELLKHETCYCIGLEYIEEYINPDNPRDIRMYKCRLAGCKSAWGDSESMKNHVCGIKHQRNFFVHVEGIQAAAKINKAELMQRAMDYAMDNNLVEKNFDLIKVVKDWRQYQEIRERPLDWSEAKENFRNSNPNHVPLGKRKNPDSNGFNHSKQSEILIPKERDDFANALTMISNMEQALQCFERSMQALHNDCSTEMITMCVNMMDQYHFCREIFEGGCGNDQLVRHQLDKLQERENKLKNSEEFSMITVIKDVSLELIRLEHEVKNFGGSNGDVIYDFIMFRISSNEEKLRFLYENNDDINALTLEIKNMMRRLGLAKHELSQRGVNISELLASKFRVQEELKTEKIMSKFQSQLQDFVSRILAPYDFESRLQLETNLAEIVNEVSEREKEAFAKSKKPWKEFMFNDDMRRKIADFVNKKMASLKIRRSYNI